ncbi:ABC-F family ATP-binding cassette domain-containing protein [Luteibacter sp. 329MFSha]|uniref:ABC-F family ATP-binding cassette domain-containing protein n=1 Tax=Luteibacter sp. 329MFSha TaxID=1798239 RepID=UPI0008C182CF|nr:ABC-F family ATP-binding cassette domain-containing protein [Luteibacter sp. 329MFSha]SEW28244.1 ATPase components of ABC transporters with duplicated ATPase domains [Luteibacter sp. 329MFSha]
MTTTYLALDGASFILPDGRTLFSDLHDTFDERRTGLVGRNGVGKSVLARVLAGQAEATSGRVVRHGTVYYLAQRVADDVDETVASLAGVGATIDALGRIEAGSSDPADFDAVDDRWDARERLRDALDADGLAHVGVGDPARRLSGGEAMRVALLGARLRGADYLILDEPSNHLDGAARVALLDWIRAWPGGLLVVSHDRTLLRAMERIVELTPSGLRSYGGGYDVYAEARQRERENALRELEARKAERKRGEAALRDQRERQERRQSRGRKDAADANQAPILLGGQKGRSEASAGRLRRRQEDARDALSARVADASKRVDDDASVALLVPAGTAGGPRRVALLDGVTLPFVRGAAARVDLIVGAGQRIGVVGPNGSGKSTLLHVLAGNRDPIDGRRDVPARVAFLDQRLAALDASRPLIDQMREANPAAGEDALRLRLALLGIDAGGISAKVGSLSGGERLKAALAHALVAEPPPGLLLLDEPGNHLDLASLEALEAMLSQYDGALVVVSHDEAFLDRLGLTHRLEVTASGWVMQPL